LTLTGTPAGYDYMCHYFTWWKPGKLRKLPTIASPRH
jgi:hypothetical protein